MGQISIPMANKVGYSMYWNSMWDNKINYTRSFKEDIYLEKFINLLYNDSISSNFIFLKNKKISKISVSKYKIQLKKENKNNMKNYFLKKNSFTSFNSKIWILKYQNWIIIYFFTYLPIFNNLKKKNVKLDSYNKSRSVMSIYSKYLKSNELINLSVSSFNKNFKKYF